MEPLSLSLTLATIVGLLSDFLSSRDRTASADVPEFLEWLRFHGHNELRESIERNAQTTASIKALLADGQSAILGRLARIEALLGLLLKEEGAFRELAISVSPQSTLSPQAIEILIAFETAGAGKALFHQSFQGADLLFLDGRSGGYAPTDERFFEADLQELVDLKLCDLGHNKKGEKLYILTRRGAALAKSAMRA